MQTENVKNALLFQFTNYAGVSNFMSLEDVTQRFLLAKNLDGQLYLHRWSLDNEPLEIVFDEFLREELKARIDSIQYLNQLLNALIVFLEGGNPAPYLEADKDELYLQHCNEMDELKTCIA